MPDRDYQANLLTHIRQAAVAGHKKVLVVVPTGGGKGYVSARMMELAAGKGSDNIFFAEQRELVFQLEKQLDKLDIPCKVLMSGVKRSKDLSQAKCSVIAKNTLWSRAFKTDGMEAPPANLVQIDECHGALAQTYLAIMSHYADALSVGWTATHAGQTVGTWASTTTRWF